MVTGHTDAIASIDATIAEAKDRRAAAWMSWVRLSVVAVASVTLNAAGVVVLDRWIVDERALLVAVLLNGVASALLLVAASWLYDTAKAARRRRRRTRAAVETTGSSPWTS